MAYMLAAFAWWAILLNKKNEESYHLKNRLLHLDNQYSVNEIEETYQMQRRMIMGEGLVFGISIILGVFLIHRGFWTEIKSNKKLSNFLLSVTHELKTPIASLNLINRTLANKELPQEKVKDLLHTANEESRRLESLVDNILTTAQIEQSYDYNFELINISSLLKTRIERAKKINPGRVINSELASDLMSNVDQEAFVKMIDNLISNAIKYSPSSKPVKIKLTDNQGKINMQVIDQGLGIPKEEKDRIIDKFYRIGNEETRETKGTGLGLFIVKQIVNAHKGKLIIDSNTPTGSIFSVTLPKKTR